MRIIRAAIAVAVALALGILVGPLAAEAQQAGTVWRIGILSPGTTPSETARRQSPLMQKLAELGYVENQNLVVEYRAAEGKIDRLPELAVELVQVKVDAIFTASSPGVPSSVSPRFRCISSRKRLHLFVTHSVNLHVAAVVRVDSIGYRCAVAVLDSLDRIGVQTPSRREP